MDTCQFDSDWEHMANKIETGMVWESVPDSELHRYEILDTGELMSLRRLYDGGIVQRFRGQVANYGSTRDKRDNE
jgi:hypothetical protein